MLRETITLDKALQMEEKGEITIYHPNTVNSIFLNNLQWENTEPYTVSWVYMYGKRANAKVKLDEKNSRGQYVYILINVAYPGICKIGKAVTPSKRIKQINGAGTVSEWELKYALPVSDDYKVEKLIHKELEHLRMSSFQGSSREFFEIEFEEAVKVLENLGEVFAIANPILY
jgi:hypothetical protein